LCFAEIKGYKDKLIDYYVEAVDCAPTAIEKKVVSQSTGQNFSAKLSLK